MPRNADLIKRLLIKLIWYYMANPIRIWILLSVYDQGNSKGRPNAFRIRKSVDQDTWEPSKCLILRTPGLPFRPYLNRVVLD